VLLDGGCVAIAPEGETTWDGRLQSPLAPGAAWLALHTAVPIIPIISRGGYDVQPLWQREKIHLTGRIRVRIGQPLVLCEQPLERVHEVQLQSASQRLWQVLADLIVG
jgi:1-acyl-sn-glycerol-3-phosphate acyltransferase